MKNAALHPRLALSLTWIATRVVSIFAIHVAFVFVTYGSHFFGIRLPYSIVMAIWLGLSSLTAAVAYGRVFFRSQVFRGVFGPVIYAVAATCVSLFIGLFLAFNTYGT